MKIYVGVHIKDKPRDFLPLENLDFDRDIEYLKKEIAAKLKNEDAKNLNIVYNGLPLNDAGKLSEVIKPNVIVHCFSKTKQYKPRVPDEKVNTEEGIARAKEAFSVIANVQINVNSRVNILQKILTEYPEFRRNLGAQALIRDSVLFNTIYQPEVIKNIAKHYPLICEAAPFIVDTIKKELKRNASTLGYMENPLESPNSSEEENSLGGGGSGSGNSGGNMAFGGENASEESRIRAITRQQLEEALAQAFTTNTNSVNSLSNIAQRNTDSPAHGLSTSASGDRISTEMFRTGLARALNLIATHPTPVTPPHQSSSSSTTPGTTTTATRNDDVQEMDTYDENLAVQQEGQRISSESDDGVGMDIPLSYRTHQYAEQLRTMAQMGFMNYEENLTFLNLTNGNIENAINLLMGSMN